MPKQLTQAEFLAKAVAVHGVGRYDYSQTVYLPAPQKLAICCPSHGIFMQPAASHLIGKGCPLCANFTKIRAAQAAIRKWDTESFIARCQELHPSLDFSNSVYTTGKNDKATYVCPAHGVKSSYINALLKGHACRACYNDRRRDVPLKNKEQWLGEFIAIHGYKYDYSLLPDSFFEWDKLPIVCSIHGQFTQEATSHRQGSGCKKCSNEATSLRQAKPLEHYLARFRAVHNARYNYDALPSSFSATEPLPILCLKHGVFKQSADTHAAGHGCRKCASEALSVASTGKSFGWGYKQWLKKAEGKEATLYLLRVTLGTEEFFKIGITCKPIEKRFTKSNMPYAYELLASVTLPDPTAISELERNLKRRFTSKKYRPALAFAGRSECYQLDSRLEEAFPDKPLPVGRRPSNSKALST